MPRVMIVDDDPDIRRLLGRFLRRAGHEVVEAASADEGLAELRKACMDLVLLDLEMPVKDGVACLAAIRRNPEWAGVPVVMVTAAPAREVVLRVAKLGIQGMVIKHGEWVPTVVDQTEKLCPAGTNAGAAQAPGVAARAPASRDGGRADAMPVTPVAPAPSTPQPSGAAKALARVVPVVPIGAWTAPELEGVEESMTVERAMEVLKSLKPIIAKSELLDLMLAETMNVRAMKPAAQQVLHLTQRAETSVQSIANAIRQDQALSLRILKVANSSLYTRGEPLDSVPKAVARIGMEQIRTAVLSVSVLDAFSSLPNSGSMRPEWFWEHSAGVGLLAMRLSEVAGRAKDHCDTMFTAGLLHDLGRLLLVEQIPEHYPRVIEVADRLELPLEVVESRLLLMNHADITDRLLRHWHFPPTLIAPVAFHHLSVGAIKQAAPRLAEDVIPLALANRLAHAMLLGNSGNEVIYAIDEFVEHLRLDAKRLADICTGVIGQLADLRTNMLLHADHASENYHAFVRSRLAGIRPTIVSPDPAIDPMAMMFDMLHRDCEPEESNVIILRITGVEDRVGALRRMNELSLEGDVNRRLAIESLPVLVVGNTRACFLNDGALGRRPVRQVTLPISIPRLAHELGKLAGKHATPVAA